MYVSVLVVGYVSVYTSVHVVIICFLKLGCFIAKSLIIKTA